VSTRGEQGDRVDKPERVRDLVAQLESMDGSTAAVDPVLGELRSHVEHHVQEEESDALPKFRSAVDESMQQTLADQVKAAKRRSPPRPQRPRAGLPVSAHRSHLLGTAISRMSATARGVTR
jgi:hypothetical protein